MEAKIGKYGIWISDEEMRIIQNALEWLENSCCNEIPKIADVKNLRNDLEKIKKNGMQIPKKVEIPNEEDVFNIQCKECD
tara:strand:+ start:1250 stop:1489 length:240 start_codon:yes stop_codon:yes gene_type:complete